MKKTYLLVINDGPYGNERPYNALRLALELLKSEEAIVKVFLVGDGAQCAQSGHDTPQGFYNIERMIRSVANRGTVYA